MKVLALGADDPAPDENTVISSEPVSILFVLRYVYILTSYFHAGLWRVVEQAGGMGAGRGHGSRPTLRTVSRWWPAG